MIKVLVADDSAMMRSAIRRLLQEESDIEIVGEASDFTETMQMISDFQPAVLLLDLNLPEQRAFTPAFVREQLQSVECTLAVSFANDNEAKALADSYGALLLLDKMNLYNEMIPAIKRCPTDRTKTVPKKKKDKWPKLVSSQDDLPATQQESN